MRRFKHVLAAAAIASLVGAIGLAEPAEATPSAPMSTGDQQVYVVMAGDYLSGIAVRLGVKLNDLLKLNGLTLNSVIHPGSRLVVPYGGVVPEVQTYAPTSSASSTVYVVKAGDYLYGIALQLRVSLDQLLMVNRLNATSLIYPGMKLAVPTSTTPSVTASAQTAAVSAEATGQIDAVLAFALAQRGKPYAFNTSGPDSYDCSGLTMAAFAEIGISLPHYSGAQVRYGASVDWASSPIMSGDLVFLESSVGSGVINHVGIATSATHWVHAPRSGDVVRTGSIPMYRVVAVRRLVGG